MKYEDGDVDAATGILLKMYSRLHRNAGSETSFTAMNVPVKYKLYTIILYKIYMIKHITTVGDVGNYLTS